jgi:hypothetical protein
VRLDPIEKTLTFESGAVEAFDHAVSSIPLPELIPMIVGAPREVLDAAAKLACSTAVIVNLGVDRPELVDAHWTYFYDRDVIFSRLSTPYLQSPNNVPPGCSSLQAECYFSAKYKPLEGAPNDLIPVVIADLERCGILRETTRSSSRMRCTSVRERHLRSRPRRRSRDGARVSRRDRTPVLRPLRRVGVHLDRRVVHERRERGAARSRRLELTVRREAPVGASLRVTQYPGDE